MLQFHSPRFFLNVLVIAGVCALPACTGSDNAPPPEPSVRLAKLLVVGEADAHRRNRFPAVIDAARLSELSFSTGGELIALPFKQSQMIKQGDVIAKLDQRDLKTQISSVKAKFDNADAEYQRAVRLSEKNAIAKNVLDQRRTQLDVARAQLDTAKKSLADAVMHAPFDGVIAQLPKKRLQNVRAGETVVVLMGGGGFEATIDVPAKYIARVPKGEQRDAAVILETDPNRRIEAEFKNASLIADSGSQTYAVTFSFLPPEDRIILPGMNATVELSYEPDQHAGRMAVPLSAIFSTDGQHYVWVVDSQTMQVARTKVTVEEGVGETMVVSAGLEPSTTIVAAGSASLSEGQRVRAWTP
ncbi:MAG: efflux RND transporter periplasmic adaptor subunit [Gammaproteobacteria bacterium]|nr:efflux RND transporter periplasmic adaptor subunit [Gammaproteobacteria bacterium]